jgi:molybdopterin converting factor small subunit
MTVGFLGAIRQITGVREQKLAAPTVEALLASLLDLYGDSWKEQVFDGEDLISGVIVMVTAPTSRGSRDIPRPFPRGTASISSRCSREDDLVGRQETVAIFPW